MNHDAIKQQVNLTGSGNNLAGYGHSGTISGTIGACPAGTLSVKPASEIEQENIRLRAAIGGLHDQISTLYGRLDSVRVAYPEAENAATEGGPSSDLGRELRDHVNGVEYAQARLARLLGELAL